MKEKSLKEKSIDLLTVFIMVMIMVIYNSLWKGRITPQSIKRLIEIYPIIVTIVLIVKTFISTPLAKNVHQHSTVFKPDKFHLTMPAMIIPLNAVMVGALSTYFFHNYHSGHFLGDYTINVIRSLCFSLPVYFFLISPLVKKVKKWVRVVA